MEPSKLAEYDGALISPKRDLVYICQGPQYIRTLVTKMLGAIFGNIFGLLFEFSDGVAFGN